MKRGLGILLIALLFVLAAAIVFGYLFLVAQYESWTMPLGILLSVTVALFGALAAVLVTGRIGRKTAAVEG